MRARQKYDAWTTTGGDELSMRELKKKKKGFLTVVKSIRDLWLKRYHSTLSFETVRELSKNLLDAV